MSWSVYNMIGTPDKIVAALDKQSENLSGVSKEEFDDAATHIKALVQQNVGNGTPPVLQVNANGHGTKLADGTWTHKTCTVEVKNLGGMLV